MRKKPTAIYLDPGEEPAAAPAPPVEQLTFQEGIFHLHGQPMSPFAIDRESAWHLHRSQIGAPPVDRFQTIGEWGLDALRILWFCSHAPADWISAPTGESRDGQWVRYTPEERATRLEIRISDWASSTLSTVGLTEVVSIALAIMASANKNRAVPVPSGKGGTPSGN